MAEGRAAAEGPAAAEGLAAFRRYLEAKFELDSASLNPNVAALFRERLCAQASPRLLDIGTGTGAMLRRLLELPLRGETVLVGLDRDAGSLEAARREVARALRAAGWVLYGEASRARSTITARRGGRRLRVELARGDILGPELPEPVAAGGFCAVTAHAVLDLLPVAPALARLRSLLSPGGLLYATLNYDGVTTLLPPEAPGGFEQRLLAEYDRSMERRRAPGPGSRALLPTGGAHSGRRLYAAAAGGGFQVLGVGASDWCLFPHGGRYSPAERLFLRTMLGFIAAEGARRPRLPADELRRWLTRRLAQTRAGTLGLVVHQLDLLLQRA